MFKDILYLILQKIRARQLLQSPLTPPTVTSVPPPYVDPSPYGQLTPGIIDNSTAEDVSLPTITGPSAFSIQNVSVYLTGVLLPGFSVQPPSLIPANTSGYEIVLQVDFGSMLINLPSALLSTVKHQVAVGNFWIGIPDDEWNLNPYAWVPGAGIQFAGTIDECNDALKTLSYGKGLGNGKKSKTVLTMICYPMVNGEPFTVAKALKSCTMDIEGAGAWFTIFQYTKLFYTTSVGVLGMGLSFLIILCCILGCCVCYQNRKERLFLKNQVFVKAEDALYDETRVFNPFWIPSAAVKVGDDQFIITPNPKFHQQLQSEHITRMHSIGRDGDLDAMQFLAAAAAAASTDGDPNTTSEERTVEEDSVSTGATSSLGPPRPSHPSRSTSRTSRTSRMSFPKSTRFAVKADSSTPAADLMDPAADATDGSVSRRTSLNSSPSISKSTRFSIKDDSPTTTADSEDSSTDETDGSSSNRSSSRRTSRTSTSKSISTPKSDTSESKRFSVEDNSGTATAVSEDPAAGRQNPHDFLSKMIQRSLQAVRLMAPTNGTKRRSKIFKTLFKAKKDCMRHPYSSESCGQIIGVTLVRRDLFVLGRKEQNVNCNPFRKEP
ncbi:hypothetical protein R1flu_027571 [Riccia fluitans]|uniref:Uncharacterized protein n=1 Tax=Riccia fluitans TaxID=41844 RepID=A0ABD1XN82_9MARC